MTSLEFLLSTSGELKNFCSKSVALGVERFSCAFLEVYFCTFGPFVKSVSTKFYDHCNILRFHQGTRLRVAKCNIDVTSQYDMFKCLKLDINSLIFKYCLRWRLFSFSNQYVLLNIYLILISFVDSIRWLPSPSFGFKWQCKLFTSCIFFFVAVAGTKFR